MLKNEYKMLMIDFFFRIQQNCKAEKVHRHPRPHPETLSRAPGRRTAARPRPRPRPAGGRRLPRLLGDGRRRQEEEEGEDHLHGAADLRAGEAVRSQEVPVLQRADGYGQVAECY